MEFNVQNIPLDNSFDLLCSVSVFESVSRVFEGGPRWTNVRDHNRAAVATERVFQQSCQLGVTEGNVTLSGSPFFVLILAQCIDTVSKS